jgi:hypothetical protein
VIEHEGAAPTTVTVALHVDVLPVASVTVSVTVLAPILEQSNEVLDADNVIGPHSSLLPLLISAAVIEAKPFTNATETCLQIATGGVASANKK